MLMTVRGVAIDAQCVSSFVLFFFGGGEGLERRPLFYLSSILRTLRTMLSENRECQPRFEPGAAW